VDGARFANAVASIGGSGASPAHARALSIDAGVDVLSFGGTKNGMLYGEAVVFFDKELAADFGYLRKQAMQLPSKMRFVAAQFEALLQDGLWLRSAARANALAKRLEAAVRDIPGLRLTQPVEANSVFAAIPREAIERIRARSPFYTWDETVSEVRWMTSFDTTEEDVDGFAAWVRDCIAR
jgi:threonine aldolase